MRPRLRMFNFIEIASRLVLSVIHNIGGGIHRANGDTSNKMGTVTGI